MVKKIGRSAKMSDPRQLALFAELQPDDPVATYYRRLRKVGASLTLNLAEDCIYVHTRGSGVPAWAMRELPPLRARIRADLLQYEHGIEPQEEPERLDGGAVLHRLRRTRRSPDEIPPVRRRTPRNRRGPGAA